MFSGIIRGSNVAREIRTVQFLLLLMTSVLMALFTWIGLLIATMRYHQAIDYDKINSISLVGFAGGCLIMLVIMLEKRMIPKLLKETVDFRNARDALSSGYLMIVTNSDKKMCQIAEEVSKCLSQLGVSHYLADEYVKHLIVKKQNAFYQASLDDIASLRPDNCKLSLVLSAQSCSALESDSGVTSVIYGLVDNGHQSVIRLNYNSGGWPLVSFFDKKVPTPKVIAKAIVEGMFGRINLTIWAVPPPAK